MGYKQISQSDLRTIMKMIGSVTSAQVDNAYRSYAKTYFPDTVAYFIVSFDSEYDDEGYENKIQYVIAYDENDEEVAPLKQSATAARQKWSSLPTVIENRTTTQVRDVVVRIKPLEINLYVKTDD